MTKEFWGVEGRWVPKSDEGGRRQEGLLNSPESTTRERKGFHQRNGTGGWENIHKQPVVAQKDRMDEVGDCGTSRVRE